MCYKKQIIKTYFWLVPIPYMHISFLFITVAHHTTCEVFTIILLTSEREEVCCVLLLKYV